MDGRWTEIIISCMYLAVVRELLQCARHCSRPWIRFANLLLYKWDQLQIHIGTNPQR